MRRNQHVPRDLNGDLGGDRKAARISEKERDVVVVVGRIISRKKRWQTAAADSNIVGCPTFVLDVVVIYRTAPQPFATAMPNSAVFSVCVSIDEV